MNFDHETLIFNTLSHPVMVFDPDLNVIALSNGWVESFNMKREEWVGSNIKNVMPMRKAMDAGSPEGSDFHQALLLVRDSKSFIERPIQKVKIRDQISYWKPKSSPVLNSGGTLLYIIHELKDVTPLITTEQNLNRLEVDLLEQTTLTDILDRQSDGFVVVDGNFSITFINKRFLDFVGLNPSDVLGKTLDQLLTNPDAIKFIKRYKEVIRTQASIHFQDSYSDRILSVDAYPAKNGGTAIFYRDITERTIHEEQEKNSRLELEKALKIRDDFISIASHELKTPLTTLMLQNQFARKKFVKNGSLPEKDFDHFLSVSLNSMNKLNRLIDDMLDVTRIHNGKVKLNLEEVNLSKLTQEIVGRYSAHINKMSFKSDSEIKGIWDKVRIDQVISNLVTNAIKYGNETPIRVETYEENNQAIISVRDSGPGIAPENHQKIFDRFERIDPTATISGLGLGLHIVKEILERHGGKIQVISDLGQGAHFKVTLPIKR